MKNLNKALAMLIVFAMMMSSVAFAATFSDVADGSAYADAIGVGVALNLYNGYDDGTFQPEGNITRAEFAAIVVRAMGQGDVGQGGTVFTDVPSSHWASGFIGIAAGKGIINGYGDGTFGPENQVLFEQAVKMLVIALGYAPTCDPDKGYPVQYLSKAGELGITSATVRGTTGSPANRGLVAQLVYNSLNIPLMQQSGYGTYVDYIIYDGYGDTVGQKKTFLSEYLGAVKIQAQVIESSATSGSSKKVETVKTETKRNYKSKWGLDGDVFEEGEFCTYDVGTTNASAFVGNKVLLYAWYDPNSSDNPVIAYIAKDTTATDTLLIESDMIESVTPIMDGTKVSYYDIVYRESADAKKTSTVTLEGGANVYNNSVLQSDSKSFFTSLMNGVFYGELNLELIGSDSSYDYDSAFVTQYVNVVVDTVNAGSYRVTSKNGQKPISFDPKDSNVKSTLVDESGNEMAWTDLKEDDVVTCVISENGSKRVVRGRLVDNKITGTVTMVDDSDPNAVEYTIGGTVYKADPKSIEDSSEIALGDDGMFFLDARDRIVYYDTEGTISDAYAYIVGFETIEGIESKAEVKMFLKDGSFVTAKTTSKVKVDGISSIPSKDLDSDYDLPSPRTDASLINKQGTTWFNMAGNTVTGVKKLEVGQFVTFTRSGDLISGFDRPAADIDKGDAKGKFTQYAVGATADYHESSNYFLLDGSKKVYVDDNTIIMVAPTALGASATSYGTPDDDEEVYGLKTLAQLSDETEVTGLVAFNVYDSNPAKVVLLLDDVIDGNVGFAALMKYKSTTNPDGDSVYSLYTLKDGIDNSSTGGALCTTDLDSSEFAEGQIAIPSLNAANAIKNWAVLAAPDAASDTTIYNDAELEDRTKGDIEYKYGRVTRVKGSTVSFVPAADAVCADYAAPFIPNDGDIDDFKVPGSANVYIYDENAREGYRVSIGDVSDIMVQQATSSDVDNYGVALDQVVYNYFASDNDTVNIEVVVREDDGNIVDVMFYIYANAAKAVQG